MLNRNFLAMRSPRDFFLWARGVFMNGLYQQYEFDEGSPGVGQAPAMVYKENVLLGGIRFRQQRGLVQKQSNCNPLPQVPETELAQPASVFTSMDPILGIQRVLTELDLVYDRMPQQAQWVLQSDALAQIEGTKTDCYLPLWRGAPPCTQFAAVPLSRTPRPSSSFY